MARPGAATPGAPEGLDRDRLLHELSVHQIELEMQNEQLRRAQLELERSRDRYADLFESAPVGFVTFASSDTIAEANHMAAELLRTPQARLAGMRFHGFLAPDDQPRFQRALSQLLKLDGPRTLQVRLAPAVDASRALALEMALRRERGIGMQCRVALIDVTERLQMQELESRLASIVSSSDDAIIGRDLDGRVTSWNGAAERLFGLPATDILGRPMTPLIPLERRGEEESLLRRLRAGERLQQFETERLDVKGDTLPLSLTLSPVHDGEGHLVGSSLIARDISDRVRADQALRVRLRQLDALSHAGQSLILGKLDPSPLQRELFERVSEAVGSEVQLNYEVTDDGSALILQSATGLSQQQFARMRTVGMTDTLCGTVAEQRRPLILNYLQSSTLSQARLLQQAGLRCYAGFPLIARGQVYGVAAFGSTSAEHFGEGSLQVMQTVCDQASAMFERTRLLDELHAREQMLKRADRAKDEFIATLAHELRNPLAPIRNAVGIMRHEDRTLSPQLAWCRDIIDRQIGQMTHLLEDLLDVSRVTRNKIELRRDRIDLHRALEQAIEAARPLIEAQRQRLEVQVLNEPCVLYGDLTRLTQVFANLLNNAAKYTDPGGTITMSLACEGDTARVSVRDSGIGIDQHQLPRVFDMFSQLAPALERARGGLGIGLALTRGLVDLHGGTIEVFSAGVGQGSEFVVRLPIERPARAQEKQLPQPDASAAAAPRRRLLVVDDNVDAAQTLAAILELHGHDVRVAYGGAEGLRIAQEWQPDVAVLDIGIPDLNGYELARGIRERDLERQPMLIACTGWGQEEDVARAREAGFDHHLVKPVDPDAVLKLLAHT